MTTTQIPSWWGTAMAAFAATHEPRSVGIEPHRVRCTMPLAGETVRCEIYGSRLLDGLPRLCPEVAIWAEPHRR